MKNLRLSSEARAFADAFYLHRSINREFYERVPEDQFDFRMVHTPTKQSDSPRESLAHQINVQKTYLLAVQTGSLVFGAHYDNTFKEKSKNELLSLMSVADQELMQLLAQDSLMEKMVIVPWNPKGIAALTMLWSLNSHEILHTGWNLALMDHLGMERFPALKSVWG